VRWYCLDTVLTVAAIISGHDTMGKHTNDGGNVQPTMASPTEIPYIYLTLPYSISRGGPRSSTIIRPWRLFGYGYETRRMDENLLWMQTRQRLSMYGLVTVKMKNGTHACRGNKCIILILSMYTVIVVLAGNK
jgi:hypothetical protein